MRNTFARSLAEAQQTVAGIDTRDVSSLAYVSSLVALETVLPLGSAEETEFTVAVFDDNVVVVDVTSVDLDHATRQAINAVASHYFQARQRNVPVSVH